MILTNTTQFQGFVLSNFIKSLEIISISHLSSLTSNEFIKFITKIEFFFIILHLNMKNLINHKIN